MKLNEIKSPNLQHEKTIKNLKKIIENLREELQIMQNSYNRIDDI